MPYNAFGQPVGDLVPDWSPRPRPPRTPMQGRHGRVEPLDPRAHAAELWRAFGHDVEGRNWTYLPYGPFADPAAFRAWLEDVAAGDDPLFHTIIGEGSGPAGLAAYLRINPDGGTIEIGHIHLSPLVQRRPVATEAIHLMMARVFDGLGYRRFEWKCDALNAPSRAAALRLGFAFEGVFRQAAVVKGRNRDTAWYSILDGEWPTRDRAFRAWLDPANFDDQGRQRQGLRKFHENESKC